MWKVFLVISAVVLAGAGYFSYSNMGAYGEKLDEEEATKADLVKRQGDLESTNQEIAALEQSIEKLKNETSDLQTEEVDLKAKLVQNQSDVSALETKLAEAKENLESAKALAGDLPKVQDLQRQMVQIRTQIEEAEIEVTQAEGAAAAAKVEADRLARVAKELEALRKDQEIGLIRNDFQSTVQKAYNQWGFVIVNGGFDQGVVNRAQLDVYRRGANICKLLVTSVEASSCVGEIIPGSLSPGQSVQEGDTVVKTVLAVPSAPVETAPAAGGAPTQAPAETAPDPASADPFGGGGDMSGGDTAPDPFGGGGMAPAPAGGGEPDPFGGGGGGDMQGGGDTPPDPFQ